MSTTTIETTATLTSGRTAPRPAIATYARLDLRRQLRDRMGMFFIIGLPTFMYLVFGLGSDDPVGSGNVGMYVMISMAAYGAVTATTSVAGSAAMEQVMGWGRQLGLTPMRPLAFVAAKAAVAMTVAAMPTSELAKPMASRPRITFCSPDRSWSRAAFAPRRDGWPIV